MNKNKPAVGLIGCGNMGSALVPAIAASIDKLVVFDVDREKSLSLTQSEHVEAVLDIQEIVEQTDIIILAVKPAQIPQLNVKITGKLLISIAAGISLSKLTGLFPSNHIIRVMPNTPALISRGVFAYTTDSKVNEDEVKIFSQLFAGCGSLFAVNEELMDAVTGLSGSGPAYVFAAINAMAEGGVIEGIPKQTALQMAALTFAGAADMVVQQKVHPEILKDRVTSPGGTTAAGLASLEEGAFRSLWIKAVQSAAQRSRELGDE